MCASCEFGVLLESWELRVIGLQVNIFRKKIECETSLNWCSLLVYHHNTRQVSRRLLCNNHTQTEKDGLYIYIAGCTSMRSYKVRTAYSTQHTESSTPAHCSDSTQENTKHGLYRWLYEVWHADCLRLHSRSLIGHIKEKRHGLYHRGCTASTHVSALVGLGLGGAFTAGLPCHVLTVSCCSVSAWQPGSLALTATEARPSETQPQNGKAAAHRNLSGRNHTEYVMCADMLNRGREIRQYSLDHDS
jgi:hypothetical protein